MKSRKLTDRTKKKGSKAPLPNAAGASTQADEPAPNRRARQPLRERGRTRFQLLLDAPEALLAERSPDDIGLYQIAKQAGVAPASAYHFLPTTNAALLALAERFHGDIRAVMNEPLPTARLISWQDLLVVRHERAVRYYNSHLPAAKIFLGIHPSWEIHQADKEYNRRASQSLYEYFDRYFVMPYVKDPEPKFEIMYSLADAVWAISFERHSTIIPSYAEEALAVCVAYCRTFLPDRVERRAVVDATGP